VNKCKKQAIAPALQDALTLSPSTKSIPVGGSASIVRIAGEPCRATTVPPFPSIDPARAPSRAIASRFCDRHVGRTAVRDSRPRESVRDTARDFR